MTIVARRDLAIGEEISFYYLSTEWAMATPFRCRCGASGCIKLVAGAHFTPLAELERYFLNAHIRDLMTGAIERQRETCRTCRRQPMRHTSADVLDWYAHRARPRYVGSQRFPEPEIRQPLLEWS